MKIDDTACDDAINDEKPIKIITILAFGKRPYFSESDALPS